MYTIGQFSQIGFILWINANDYLVAGPPFEAYVKTPCHTNNPEEYITELSFPVTK